MHFASQLQPLRQLQESSAESIFQAQQGSGTLEGTMVESKKKNSMKLYLKLLIGLGLLIIAGIFLLYLIRCYNPERIISESPYDNHNITFKNLDCMFVAMSGHGRRGSISRFSK